MTARKTAKGTTGRTAPPTQRAAPVPTQHLAEVAWHVMEDQGEDVLVPREVIISRIHASDSQFERLKGYVRDHLTMEHGKAFLAYRGGYMITTDPAKIAENVTWRLRRIDTELRRLLTGWINPLGSDVNRYEVLSMYQDDIGHMLRVSERMRSSSAQLPKPVKTRTRRRSRASR
ncbi:hypothetical protein [Streptomyces sp. JJ38]|uniref:hypothetical protein n=1 Tax=Streptomyces sp. JJ38 TaxID=2738128 RepID=UPI001C59AFFE|nr:hypothetical protein [Streptomyces sp. JJ38]MBW1597249.1 hypothetical protein [Streptomyces sp. JJ38]